MPDTPKMTPPTYETQFVEIARRAVASLDD